MMLAESRGQPNDVRGGDRRPPVRSGRREPVGQLDQRLRRAIGLLGAECPRGGSEWVLDGNQVEGSTGAQTCTGINLFATIGYTATQNVAHSNGSTSCFPRGGIILGAGASANTLTNNDSSNNNGFGISIGPGTNGNAIVNNTARGNALVDLNAFPGTTNHWNQNNRCHTEGGAVPSTVCNRGE